MDINDLAELYGEELQLKKLIRNSSARAQEIAKRAKLDSSDGQTIEDHDQFYKDHKLLLLLFRVSSIFFKQYSLNFKDSLNISYVFVSDLNRRPNYDLLGYYKVQIMGRFYSSNLLMILDKLFPVDDCFADFKIYVTTNNTLDALDAYFFFRFLVSCPFNVEKLEK